jgi:sulfite exporter TauE/SafE
MVVFGVATVPALLGVSVADGLLAARQRTLPNRLAQLFIRAMGCWFVWRALAG